MASEPTLSSLARLALETTDVTQDPSSSTSGGKTKEQMRKHYVRTLHKVIDESDIVILVLDARDPEGCRSRLVEEEVRRREGEGKKLVFVLNKVGMYRIQSLPGSLLECCVQISFPKIMLNFGSNIYGILRPRSLFCLPVRLSTNEQIYRREPRRH